MSPFSTFRFHQYCSYLRLQLGYPVPCCRKLTLTPPEPVFQLPYVLAAFQQWVSLRLGRACPDAGQRHREGRQVHRGSRARCLDPLGAAWRGRTVEAANARERHPREHPVRRRSHPALAAAEAGQGGQDAAALRAVRLALKPADTVGEVGDYAARAAKREVRVGASGRSANHAARRSRLRAAAVATCCSPALARPR